VAQLSQDGRVNLLMVAAVAFGIGFVALGYLNIYQYSHAQQAENLMQGQITDLTYQVRQDHAGASPTPAPGSSSQQSSSSPAPSSSPQVAGASSTNINISQMGVKFTANDPVGDLTYQWVKDGPVYMVAAFTTASLQAKYSGCTAGTLGELVQKPADSTASTGDEDIKTIGNNKYYFIAKPLVPGSCATDSAGQAVIAQDSAAVRAALLASLN
jgi:hypothetical protein